MRLIIKLGFERDIQRVKDKHLLQALDEKLLQLVRAKSPTQITGLKKLEGYDTHCRIYVKSGRKSYRIGAIIRGNTLWLVRFLPRKLIYRRFP